MYNRRLNIELRHQHTCEWILHTKEFKQWRLGMHGLLWIKGKPGAGKSTVMSFIYDELRKEVQHSQSKEHSIQLEFFFSARGTELQRTFHGMLRSLLHQLFLQDASTSELVRDSFTRKTKSLSGHPNTWEWHLSELKTLFFDTVVAASKRMPLNLFVDALDEAGELSARRIAQYFHQIQEAAGLSIVMCISCRHYPIVTSKKVGLEVAVEQHNKGDIAAFIHDTLCLDLVIESNPAEREIWQDVESELNKRAQGSFQWARLVLPIVQRRIDKGESPEWVRQKLCDVPDDLREVYIHIIESVIDRDDRHLAFFLIQWVCLAARPLTVTEIRYALAITDSPSGTTLARQIKASDKFDTDERMRLGIIPLSGGLVEVVRSPADKKEYVQVSHQSVNDFMLTDGLALLASLAANTSRISPPRPSETDDGDFISSCQGTLYWACLRCLTKKDVLAKSADGKWRNGSHGLLQTSPLIKYATLHMFFHAERAGLHRSKNLLEEVNILQQAIPQWTKFHRILGGYGPYRPAGKTTMLHLASRANMIDLVGHLVQSEHNVHEKDSNGCTALHLAVQHGHQDTSVVLIKAGADVDLPDSSGRTALVHATGRGDVYMVQWLLNHGAKVICTTLRTGNALYEAASIGNLELVTLFIDAGADVNAQDRYGATVLEAASYAGHESIVRILLYAGAQVNASQDQYSAALHAASGKGRDKVVQILLDAGANVNSKAKSGSSALHDASAGGHDGFGGHAEVVELLLDAGANVDHQGGYYGTALQAASSVGDTVIVRILLARGAYVNLRSGHCGTALQAASLSGSIDLVQLLLSKGADVNARGGCYGTALQAASFEGHTSVVEFLLDVGAYPDIQGGFFGNALRAAAVRDHEQVLCALIPHSRWRYLMKKEGPYMRWKYLF